MTKPKELKVEPSDIMKLEAARSEAIRAGRVAAGAELLISDVLANIRNPENKDYVFGFTLDEYDEPKCPECGSGSVESACEGLFVWCDCCKHTIIDETPDIDAAVVMDVCDGRKACGQKDPEPPAEEPEKGLYESRIVCPHTTCPESYPECKFWCEKEPGCLASIEDSMGEPYNDEMHRACEFTDCTHFPPAKEPKKDCRTCNQWEDGTDVCYDCSIARREGWTPKEPAEEPDTGDIGDFDRTSPVKELVNGEWVTKREAEPPSEEPKWTCIQCGSIPPVTNEICPRCGQHRELVREPGKEPPAEEPEHGCDDCRHMHISYETHPYGSTTATETIGECVSENQAVEDGAYYEDDKCGKGCPGWELKEPPAELPPKEEILDKPKMAPCQDCGIMVVLTEYDTPSGPVYLCEDCAVACGVTDDIDEEKAIPKEGS